ncbi:bifunctional alpha,alpha-trehalose-phosphate synthase (UDP-forming)/trehalose-phosphatase [Brachybacterium huguangmaarense]
MPTHDLVVVANRLPVDAHVQEDGTVQWVTSPGGLVTAMESVMRDVDSGAWVGWAGSPGDAPEPFEADGMSLYPVALSADDVALYYEGFSNATLWPLYHDVIADPEFHRTWWDAYVEVNERFARAAAAVASPGATVWVHDYQLQLVPAMIREARPDLRIGFFDHIPFPPFELFAQLPKRNQVLRGLLGADLVGFQRERDAQNFLTCVRQLLGHTFDQYEITVPGLGAQKPRIVTAKTYPISIDTRSVRAMADEDDVRERAAALRRELGDPHRIVVGVDRLDYTKGIAHRLKAWGELLAEGEIDPRETVMVQVATPSRERVEAYKQLRDEIELTVGRLNGDFAPIGRPAIAYMHRSLNRREMTALYQAADVVLVTSLRDGMNLVAKEYIASRPDERGVLVLSEFTGAADELRAAIQVNPHDIDELKTAILSALVMPEDEQREAMRSLRHQVIEHDVQAWAHAFLGDLEASGQPEVVAAPRIRLHGDDAPARDELTAALERLAEVPRILVASDFDGVIAPIVADRDAVTPSTEALDALRDLADLPGVNVALVSGRALEDLDRHTRLPSSIVLVGSHGAQVGELPHDVDAGIMDGARLTMDESKERLLEAITERLRAIAAKHPGSEVETKPTSAVLHTRSARGRYASGATEAALEYARTLPDATITPGKEVVEFSVVDASKGPAVRALARACAADAWIYLGDDVTDETAFAELGDADLGIKVGSGDTGATFRVGGPEDVPGVLEELLAARRARGGHEG